MSEATVSIDDSMSNEKGTSDMTHHDAEQSRTVVMPEESAVETTDSQFRDLFIDHAQQSSSTSLTVVEKETVQSYKGHETSETVSEDRQIFRDRYGVTDNDEHVFKKIVQDPTKHAFCGLRPGDIRCLDHDLWLNDEIINAFMKLFQKNNAKQRAKHPDRRCHFFNTFFLPYLTHDYNYEECRQWTSAKRLTRWGQPSSTILDCSLIFFPCYADSHWSLIVVDLRTNILTHYDSMLLPTPLEKPKVNVQRTMTAICSYLKDEAFDKCGLDWSQQSFEYRIGKNVPQQYNGSDCGVFIIQFARHLSMEEPLAFTQANIADCRVLMLKELMLEAIVDMNDGLRVTAKDMHS